MHPLVFIATRSVQLLATVSLIAEVFLLPLHVSAQIAVPGVPERQALALPHQAIYRIHGKVSAIDPIGKTVTIGSKNALKTMAVSQYSVVIKNGAATSFASVAIGDEADGIAGIVSVRQIHRDFSAVRPVSQRSTLWRACSE